ncbi:MAG: P27 family phage terminase small subunit [Acidimicrobiales bacterium]
MTRRDAVVRELELRGVEPGAFSEAVDAYVRAMEDVERFRQVWDEVGRPVTTEGGATGSAVVPHPLVGMIETAERRASDTLARLLLEPKAARAGSKGGRPVGASSAPDRRPAPPRLVKVS